MLEAGEASVEAIDEAIREAGFPMGPFELMDLVGIDVNLAAARGVWEGFGQARPAPPVADPGAARRGGPARTEGRRRVLPLRGRSTRGGRPEFAAAATTVTTLAPSAIAERILQAVVSEASLALEDGVATRSDIDLALRLGAAHPVGPFERTERLGGAPGLQSRS